MSSERKVALVTGITGQDGSYLAEFLLEKGYTVSARELSILPRTSRTGRVLIGHLRLTISSSIGTRHRPPFFLLQHWSYRSHLQRPPRDRSQDLSPLR